MTAQKGITGGFCTVYIVTMLYTGITGRWECTGYLLAGLILTLMPEVVRKFFKTDIPLKAQTGYLVFIFGAQYLGSYLKFYGIFPWWDVALHFGSGFLMGYCGLILIRILDRENCLYINQKTGLMILIIFLTSVASAGIWEIIEFTGDHLLGTNAQLGSLQDTMEDIICGTIGGGIFAAWIAVSSKLGKKNALSRLFEADHLKAEQNRKK